MGKAFLGKTKRKIKSAYFAEWSFFKSNLWFGFKLSLIISLLSVVFLSLILVYHRDLPEVVRKNADELITKLNPQYGQWESYDLKKAIGFFSHNVRAVVLKIASGLIPFLFLPIFFVILNGFISAIFLMAAKLLQLNVLGTYFIAIFPHGIFENIGAWYSASLGIFLCIESSKKVIPKWRRNSVSFVTIGKRICRSCILVIAPLYAIAAVVEGLITPLLVRTFGQAMLPF